MGKSDAVRMTIEVELEVEVTDPDLLETAALQRIDAAEFVLDEGDAGEAKAAEQAAVRDGGATEALLALIDPFDLIPAGVGLEVIGAVCGAGPTAVAAEPDFESLFKVCSCGEKAGCDRCTGFQLTPPTAEALWQAAQLLADRGYDDIERNGDDRVARTEDWVLFDEYPVVTYGQDAVWRRQAARSFDDLADDLAAGNWPQPTCPGEELALHLMLEYAQLAAEDLPAAERDAHPDDFDWVAAAAAFTPDTEILGLFDDQPDDVDDQQKQQLGSYRPEAWFVPFNEVPGRDGRRPFRR